MTFPVGYEKEHDPGTRHWIKRFIASIRFGAVSPQGFDKSIRIWDARLGSEIAVLQGHTGFVTDVVFSPDGSRIISGSEDRTIKVWAAETGALILTFKEHSGRVSSVSFNLDGTRLVSSSEKEITVWDATLSMPFDAN